mmetsp:Transcript_46654/g.117340  ORF Transcript_46654/g.117340 Transcript_46654/m.117340 type:complete len:206 (+) Transcript_46654:748-1365(+)
MKPVCGAQKQEHEIVLDHVASNDKIEHPSSSPITANKRLPGGAQVQEQIGGLDNRHHEGKDLEAVVVNLGKGNAVPPFCHLFVRQCHPGKCKDESNGFSCVIFIAETGVARDGPSQEPHERDELDDGMQRSEHVRARGIICLFHCLVPDDHASERKYDTQNDSESNDSFWAAIVMEMERKCVFIRNACDVGYRKRQHTIHHSKQG